MELQHKVYCTSSLLLALKMMDLCFVKIINQFTADKFS